MKKTGVKCLATTLVAAAAMIALSPTNLVAETGSAKAAATMETTKSHPEKQAGAVTAKTTKSQPAPKKEKVPEAPTVGVVWVPGDYYWDGVDWVWDAGYWLEVPWQDAIWVPGHWVERWWGWTWVPGYWY
jgi:hypothetical protein